MEMGIDKKVCVLGALRTGKTSVIHRFVTGGFSGRCGSNIGVKISSKGLILPEGHVNFVLWDIEGRDAFSDFNILYLRYSQGLIVVVDGTDKATFEFGMSMFDMARNLTGPIPAVVLFNKADLQDIWCLEDKQLVDAKNRPVQTFNVSAKSGEGIDEAFATLGTAMLQADVAAEAAGKEHTSP